MSNSFDEGSKVFEAPEYYDIFLAQQKALLRIREKRRVFQSEKKEKEEKNAETSKKARDVWKHKLIADRKSAVEKLVNKRIVTLCLQKFPNMIDSHKCNLDDTWKELVADLMISSNEPLSLDSNETSEDFDVTAENFLFDFDPLPAVNSNLQKTMDNPVTAKFLKDTLGQKILNYNQPINGNIAHGMLAKYINNEGSYAKLQSPISSVPHGHKVPENHTHVSESKLIDSLFLVGPSNSAVKDMINAAAEEYDRSAVSSSGSGSGGPSAVLGIAPTLKNTSNLAPNLLYISSLDSQVETDAFPLFCFPSGIETALAMTIVTFSSSHLPDGHTSLMSRRSIPRASAIKIGDLMQTTSNPSLSSSSGAALRYVYLLSNHTFTQYVVNFCIPKTIFYSTVDRSFAIKTWYCISLVTRYPFFAFFFHLLGEFVAMGGFAVDSLGEVIGAQVQGDPIQNELRALEALAMKLLRQAVPSPGGRLELSLAVKYLRKEMSMTRLVIENRTDENCIGTLLWALPTLLKYVPLDQLILCLGCTLTEMKVVVRSKNLEVLRIILLFIYHKIVCRFCRPACLPSTTCSTRSPGPGLSSSSCPTSCRTSWTLRFQCCSGWKPYRHRTLCQAALLLSIRCKS